MMKFNFKKIRAVALLLGVFSWMTVEAAPPVMAAYNTLVACSQLPAFSGGDITSSAGACVLTAAATLAKYAANGIYSGNNSYSGTSTWTGSFILPTRVVIASGAVTVSATTDYIVEVDKTSGAATVVNLPATPATGLTYVIKDGKGDAATNPITITPNAGNIDGSSTYVININYGSATISYDATKWIVQ